MFEVFDTLIIAEYFQLEYWLDFDKNKSIMVHLHNIHDRIL